jgi:hypothetical protein
MTAPFRITRKALRPVARESGTNFKDYLGRLTKLIPAEIISLYLVGKGMIEEDKDLLLFWTVFCLAGVIMVRLYGTADPQKNMPPQLTAVFIACVSYLVWIYSMGDIFSFFGIHVPKLGSLIVLGWTFIVPYVYKGDLES